MIADAELAGRVRLRLAGSARGADGRYDGAALAGAVRAELPHLAVADLLDLTEQLAAQLGGAGTLQPLVDTPGVTDVLVNGPGPVWVDAGSGPRPSGVCLEDEPAARSLAVRLLASAGRRLDDAFPCADARLADGTRVHAVLPPLALNGTCLSLRVPPRRTFSLADLVGLGSIPPAGARLLQRLVTARLAFLVTGGTGSGKTTVLSSLLSCCDRAERLVLVEDCAELRPDLPHVVRLQSRAPNSEGAGGVALATLVREALRMRPDRLVVGEVRGAEVLDLLTALNTGHDGGCGTVHANRAEQLPARIESLCALAGIPRPAAHSLLLAAVDAVVHVARQPGGGRGVAAVAVVVPDRLGGATVVPAYRFTPGGLEAGPGAGALDDRLPPDDGPS